MSRLLTPVETAEILRVNKVTVYRWINAGKLPFIRLPSGQARIRQTDLDKWIDGRSRAAR